MFRSALLVLFAFVIIAIANAERRSLCGRDEVRVPCSSDCEDRCNSPRAKDCKQQEKKCKYDLACRCKDGLYRNPYNNKCVPMEKCPKDGCGYGEISRPCGRVCEGTCKSPKEPSDCQEIECYKSECLCDLKGGFVRNQKTGRCIRARKCHKT